MEQTYAGPVFPTKWIWITMSKLHEHNFHLNFINITHYFHLVFQNHGNICWI